ncbi:hypothetical protein CFter6_5299 [Collimonas fungivorans]|uniref:Uncharacterized protein n=1 Tax=Collimonas fungivorans TaxID=158899 RepID=A0A127PJ73_9BURK|nr:hypothetical protein CFter6_5299 [Collimonas fungivorans]
MIVRQNNLHIDYSIEKYQTGSEPARDISEFSGSVLQRGRF